MGSRKKKDRRSANRAESARSESLRVCLNRGDGDGWTWDVERAGEWVEGLPVPYDEEAYEYDIGSRTLSSALEAAGYPMEGRHWSYTDGDYGPIGEWNRPEADRWPGWKQQGNTAYEPLLALRTVYEFAEEDYDEYRIERQHIVDAIPRETDGSIVDGDIILYAHLFNGSWDWYVAGYDPDEDIAFGYIMGLENEWGEFWLREVETMRFSQPVSINGGPTIRIPGALTECDIHWKPITFEELMARRGGAL